MAEREHGYDRGWYRYGFDHMEFLKRSVHGGGAEIDVSLAFSRGIGKPHCAFAIAYPGAATPAVGMHVHHDDVTGEDVEEWYIILEGSGIMRFTNGDSVRFGPGDLLATYPGTGHSLEVTGDEPVKFILIAPNLFRMGSGRTVDEWPERFDPRIRVLTNDETKNALTAECRDCGARWERPADDRGANSLPTWATEHPCSVPHVPLHV